MKLFKNTTGILILVLILCFLGYSCYMFYKLRQESVRNPITSSSAYIPKIYADLFDMQAKKKLKLNTTLKLKYRYPISLFTYNNNYSVEVTQVASGIKQDIDHFIIEKYKTSEDTGSPIYVPIKENGITVNYKSETKRTFSKMSILLNGDSIKTMERNKFITSYFLKPTFFSIQDVANNSVEIYAKAPATAYLSLTPVSITFMKKNNNVFLILIIANDVNNSITQYLLDTLLNSY